MKILVLKSKKLISLIVNLSKENFKSLFFLQTCLPYSTGYNYNSFEPNEVSDVPGYREGRGGGLGGEGLVEWCPVCGILLPWWLSFAIGHYLTCPSHLLSTSTFSATS